MQSRFYFSLSTSLNQIQKTNGQIPPFPLWTCDYACSGPALHSSVSVSARIQLLAKKQHPVVWTFLTHLFREQEAVLPQKKTWYICQIENAVPLFDRSKWRISFVPPLMFNINLSLSSYIFVKRIYWQYNYVFIIII